MKLFILSTLLLSFAASALEYPQAQRIVNLETRFGVDIRDDFKWMDNASNPNLYDWIREQQDLTMSQLDPTNMDWFYKKLKLYADLKKSLEAKKPEQVEQQSLAFAPIMKMFQKSVNKDNSPSQIPGMKYRTEMKSVFGGDLQRLIIIKNEDNSIADIMLVKFGRLIQWIDQESFLYNSQVDGALGGTRGVIAIHKVGSNQADDQIIYEASHHQESLGLRRIGNNYYIERKDYRDGTGDLSLLNLRTGKLHLTQDLGTGTILATPAENFVVVRSDDNANNGEILSYNMLEGTKNTILPDLGFVVDGLQILKTGDLIFSGHFDAESVIAHYKVSDGKWTQIQYSESGSLRFSKEDKEGKLEFSFNSYATAPKKLSFDLATQQFTELSAQTYPIELEAKKLHYTASNGQKAAMWLVSKKGATLNSNTPMIIYGYGGFDVTLLPRFNSLSALPWLERGGALTIVSLPGSLTYGRAWNDIAKRGGRVHSWDSFAAAGTELVKLGLTSHDKLGMAGGSNGGLLVAGTLSRHADKFKAAIPMVGVLDLLNYNLFSSGKYWEWEYGNPFEESDFKELAQICPYNNIVAAEYPATLVMTAEFDDRVDPGHSYKYLARLQENQKGSAPVLLYNKEWGGHSSRSGSEFQKLTYQAAMFTFFAQHLGL